MRFSAPASLAIMTAGAAMAAQVPPPPPMTVHTSPREARLLAWIPGPVRCDGVNVAPARMQRPWTSLYFGNTVPEPVRLGFSIDPDGRPLSISRGFRLHGTFPPAPGGEDIAPALAASRFTAGAWRQQCSVEYSARVTAMADSPVEDLVSYTITPLSGPLPSAGWARIRSPGTCLDEPRAAPATLAFPDWTRIPGTPGVKHWAMVHYDIDARGRPTDIAVASGTGNAELDRQSIQAVSASRYRQGPRTGCQYPYWRQVETLSAPPLPSGEEYEALRPEGATCPRERDWASPPQLIFPEAWRRRAIEGWAVVVYDVAPWGDIGNIRTVDVQPSDEFARAAEQVVRTARHRRSGGVTGCVDRVVFRLGAPGQVAPQPY